jgi:plasmid segregation protein ParM
MGKIFAIDHGNSAIKTEMQEFPAGLTDGGGFVFEKIVWKDKEYVLSGKRIPYMRDKTQSEEYFVLTLFALAREFGDETTCTVTLAAGLPPAHYKLGKDALRNYFMSRSPANFTYENRAYCVTFDAVHIFPQAYAAASNLIGDLKDEDMAYIIDIGGYTVDTLLLRKGTPDMAYTASLDGGTNILCNEIIADASVQFGVNLDQTQIESVLRGEKSSLQKRYIELIENHAAEFANRTINTLRERGIDLQVTHAVFVGGGSLALKKAIVQSRLVLSAEFVNETNANAVGYKRLAEIVMRGEN